MTLLAFVLLIAATVIGYVMNRSAAAAIRNSGAPLHSLAGFHGGYAALLVLVPAFVFLLLWLTFEGVVIKAIITAGLPVSGYDALEIGERALVWSEIQSIAGGRIFGTPEDWKLAAADRLSSIRQSTEWLMLAALLALMAGLLWRARSQVSATFRARQGAEGIMHGLMVACAVAAIFVTIGIIASLMFETYRFFTMVPFFDFLFGLNWEPQIPIREDQIAAVGAFGMVPVLLGTVVISVIAMLIATPVLEVLAGVPTVVYGFFAVLVIAPALRDFGTSIGLTVAPNTALAAGFVMGIMLIPFISSFADDALTAVPRSLRDGSLALGATRAETMMKVLVPAAIPGIVGGVLLAVSRAIGETMIVVMAAG